MNDLLHRPITVVKIAFFESHGLPVLPYKKENPRAAYTSHCITISCAMQGFRGFDRTYALFRLRILRCGPSGIVGRLSYLLISPNPYVIPLLCFQLCQLLRGGLRGLHRVLLCRRFLKGLGGAPLNLETGYLRSLFFPINLDGFPSPLQRLHRRFLRNNPVFHGYGSLDAFVFLLKCRLYGVCVSWQWIRKVCNTLPVLFRLESSRKRSASGSCRCT